MGAFKVQIDDNGNFRITKGDGPDMIKGSWAVDRSIATLKLKDGRLFAAVSDYWKDVLPANVVFLLDAKSKGIEGTDIVTVGGICPK